MTGNIQTFQDIRDFLLSELGEIYPEQEIEGITKFLISSMLDSENMNLSGLKGKSLVPEQKEAVIRIARELKTGKPIQYIIGETVFYGCRIMLNDSVLIPRPETEELVSLIINENKGFRGRILEIGTGSGCIAIALSVNFPFSEVTATDVSPRAIAVASCNTKLNNARVRYIESDIMDPDHRLIENADMIVSNPPYVLESEKRMMHRNILEFEPHTALFVPDNDPLRFYRAILRLAEVKLNGAGRIYMEINEKMGDRMRVLLKTSGYTDIILIKDINGKDRFIKAIKYERNPSR